MEAPVRPKPIAIDFEAPDRVREALAELGRTEDLRFAPSGRRLAIACYGGDRVAIAGVRIEPGPSSPQIAITSLLELGSPELREPHGLDFADDDTLLVANRAGGITLVCLPDETTGATPATFAALDDPLGLLDSPGSVLVRRQGEGTYEVLACNNWTGTITRHALDGHSLTEGEVVARTWLDLPDGLALSGDGRWLAVSDHDAQAVLVFDRRRMGAEAEPVGVLRGVRFPHGLRFASGDDHLLVADAGAPFVYVFAAPGEGWEGVGYPIAAIRVMNETTFARGHRSAEEGGPKGIDVHGRANVLATTAEHEPLAFFDLSAALGRGRVHGIDEALVRYELMLLAESARRDAEAAEARAQLRALMRTKAWRVTEPARRLYGAALRLRSRLSSASPPARD